VAWLPPGKIRRAPGELGNNSHPATFQQQSLKKPKRHPKPLKSSKKFDYSGQTDGGMSRRVNSPM
jgi:hypothetical protein